MRSYLQFAILLPLVLFGACATPVSEPLPLAARDIISSTDVVLPSKQNEIYVFVPDSQLTAAAGGGLLFALIDAGVNSVRTSKAETAVKPLRDSLVDFNFDEALGGELKSSLSEVSWMHVGNVRVIKEVTTDATDRALTDSRAGAVLFATPNYRLSNDGDELFLSVNVSLFPNDDALRALKQKDKSKSASASKGSKTAQELSLYRNTLKFKAKAPGATSDRDRNVAAWSANNGAAMRSILKLGAAKVAMMLADDLQRPPEDMAAKKTSTYVMGPNAVTVDGIPGQIVVTDDEGEAVRLNDGTMEFVTKEALGR